MMQLASRRKSWKPGSVMSSTTTALPGTAWGPPCSEAVSPGRVTPTDWTLPTLAPETRTSSPETTKEPLSKTARTR